MKPLEERAELSDHFRFAYKEATHSPIGLKEIERREIANQIQQFINNGGTIKTARTAPFKHKKTSYTKAMQAAHEKRAAKSKAVAKKPEANT